MKLVLQVIGLLSIFAPVGGSRGPGDSARKFNFWTEYLFTE